MNIRRDNYPVDANAQSQASSPPDKLKAPTVTSYIAQRQYDWVSYHSSF